MPLTLSDYLVAERGGAPYKLTAQQIVDLVRNNIGTTEYRVADITARDALTNITPGDSVLVDDATGDTTVSSGWAIYRSLGSGTWQKIAEQESLDITITTTDLGLARTGTTVTITNSDGTDVTIPVASNTEAGVLSAAKSVLLDLISATNPVDLDALQNDRHKPAQAAGSATTNPITVSGEQAIGFSITQLADLP